MKQYKSVIYKMLGEYFASPAAAVSYARNHGLEGPLPVRVVVTTCEQAEAMLAGGVA